MGLNRRIALLAVVITAVIGSALVASGAFAAAANTGSAGSPPDSSTSTHWRQGWPGNVTRLSWSGNVTVTSDQAKTIVSNAVKALKVGDVKDSGNVWMVSIKYNDKVIMALLLAKLNTPTSAAALNAVQDSIGKGWTAGEPKQLGFTYNVPIIDANGNPIGNIRVDGRTGDITARFSPLPK